MEKRGRERLADKLSEVTGKTSYTVEGLRRAAGVVNEKEKALQRLSSCVPTIPHPSPDSMPS